MGRTVADAPTTTRNSRAKLPAGLHWRTLDPEVHLGYRKEVLGAAVGLSVGA